MSEDKKKKLAEQNVFERLITTNEDDTTSNLEATVPFSNSAEQYQREWTFHDGQKINLFNS